jgi:8-oxo-dGTP diphosphatase
MARKNVIVVVSVAAAIFLVVDAGLGLWSAGEIRVQVGSQFDEEQLVIAHSVSLFSRPESGKIQFIIMSNMNKQGRFCPHCAGKIVQKKIDGRLRNYCPQCKTTFYDNPLPVVSAVVVNPDREILLVLRDREPKAGIWALPSGFVEVAETIEQAVVRELKEETGITGKVLRLLDTKSEFNEFYGSLIWVTFEVQELSGEIAAGDDARDARFFSIFALPELAFSPNKDAIGRYLRLYGELWAMQDSFRDPEEGHFHPLVEIITRDAHLIAENWAMEVVSHPSTQNYSRLPKDEVYEQARAVISQLGQWLIRPGENMDEIWKGFQKSGAEGRRKGYRLSEMISALSRIREHIFTRVLAQGGVWKNPVKIYQSINIVSRVNLFYDKAIYHMARGFESGEESGN